MPTPSETAVARWVAHVLPSTEPSDADADADADADGPPLRAVAIDGKTLRGSRRGERRRLVVTTMLEGDLDWPHAAQVGRLERTITVGGKTTVDTQGLVTSVPRAQADAATLLAWLRGHWGIENRLHYVRAVTLGEDAHRTGTGSGPQALATLRDLAVTWLRLDGATNLAAALRRNAARVAELIDRFRRLKN